MTKPNSATGNSRQKALKWLTQVVEKGRSTNELLTEDLAELNSQQKALAKQLLFGCLRNYHHLKTIADNLLDKPLKNKDSDLLTIIILGLYQVKYLSTPDHAAISESVELARYLKKPWASGLINGVLRRYQRESNKLEAKLAKSVQFLYSHPGWIVKKIKQDWPAEFENILKNANQHAPMTIRVNTQQISRDEYLKILISSDIPGKLHTIAPDAIVLTKAVDVSNLPGFFEGKVTVQDAAAQLAVELLGLKPSQNVLDACAAPGGKTTHILQRENVNLTAIEIVAKRADRITRTLQRLKLDCNVICSDITQIADWWNGQLFDRILLDVPCSASGVIRRNPDIKIHRKVTDLKPLVALQKEILSQIWALLKPGGILVYATCSIFKEENENQIRDFLKSNEASIQFMPKKIESLLNTRATIGYQILPGEEQMDGFFLCALKKPLLSNG